MRTRRGSKRGDPRDCAGHSRGLTATVAAQERGQVPGVENSGVRSDKDNRGGQDSADILTLRYPGDELAGGVGDEDVALADAGAQYLIVGDVGLLRWKGRADQVAAGDDGRPTIGRSVLNGGAGRRPADVEHAALHQFL